MIHTGLPSLSPLARGDQNRPAAPPSVPPADRLEVSSSARTFVPITAALLAGLCLAGAAQAQVQVQPENSPIEQTLTDQLAQAAQKQNLEIQFRVGPRQISPWLAEVRLAEGASVNTLQIGQDGNPQLAVLKDTRDLVGYLHHLQDAPPQNATEYYAHRLKGQALSDPDSPGVQFSPFGAALRLRDGERVEVAGQVIQNLGQVNDVFGPGCDLISSDGPGSGIVCFQ